jgi:hypothetical protein
MGKAVYVGAYRAGWPLSIFHPFMDFVDNVELTVGVVLVGVDVVEDVFEIHFVKVFTIWKEPGLDGVYHCQGVGMCILLGDA